MVQAHGDEAAGYSQQKGQDGHIKAFWQDEDEEQLHMQDSM